MLRSFHYAGYTALLSLSGGPPLHENPSFLQPWIVFWYHWVAGAFLRSYLEVQSVARILPSNREELGVLLDVLLLEKAIYELKYELNNRPEWVKIPIEGILQQLEGTD